MSAPAVRAPVEVQPLLRVEGLTKVFGRSGLLQASGGVRAVDGVDLAIAPGRTLGLVGESGSGKTTLARCILRLVKPTGGRVLFKGEDVLTAGRARLRALRREIQVVFQDPYQSLNPRLTVAEIVGEGWRVHPEVVSPSRRDARVAELLDAVGLSPSYRDRYPSEFSGGQRQRIGIARALALEPSLIICDEPVSALDVSVQAQVVNLLRDVQARTGVALLFVAHDLAVVRHVAHEVAVMYLGRVVERGPADEVLGRPTHPYTQALLSSIPADHPSLRGGGARIRLAGDPPSPASPPSGCRFRTRCWKAAEVCELEVPALATRPGSSHPSACLFAARA
jgi:oligopeptide transport system ATP-binding protein